MKQMMPTTFKPRLKVLNKEQAWAIHTAALEILAKTGFTVEHSQALSLLADAGCSVQDNKVKMPAYVAEKALKTAPRQIVLYDQQGNRAMDLVDDNFYYGTGSDTIFTIDVETGQRRRALLKDAGTFARLIDALGNMDFSMSMSNPEDAPVIEDIYVYVFAEMVKSSNKPICFIADSGRDIQKIYEMACAVAGGEDELAEKPFILNYSEAISPLLFPGNVMEKLIFCSEKKIPICLPSGCNAGGGGPVTLAGAMALGIAENLVGLVIHQLANPGAPFLFAPNVSILDMRTTVISYGCPEWSLTQAALADMRDEIYGLPIWAFAGSSDAKIVDAQAGAEAMFSILTAMQSRCNFIHDVGYIEHGNTSSLEMVVLADELVAMARHFSEGIPITPESLALEAIDRVAAGGTGSMFLSDPHTYQNFKEAHFMPSNIDRFRYEKWEKNGKTDIYQRCNAEVRRILDEHQVIPKTDEVLKEINQVLAAGQLN